MYELYTAQRPYAGLPHAAIAERVYSSGLRPAFPATAPSAYVELARACWATDAAARPAFVGRGGVVARLEAMATQMAAAAGGGAR
jgi:hypothetical protein